MDEELKKNILKTGTTILGIICPDGIVMAADRRATAGNLILSKEERKVFQVNDYLVISGTGMMSDIQKVPKYLSAELKLKELRSKSRPSVRNAANLLATMSYSGIRQPSMIPQQAGFLLGGFNETGEVELYSIEPAGSVVKVKDYDANFGSGMPFVLGFLERNWKPNLTLEQGIELAKESIKSSTQRDVGSGNGMDIYTITKDGIKKVVDMVIEPNYKEN